MYEVFRQYINSKTTITEEEFSLIQSLGTLKKLQKKQFLLHEGMVWKYNAFVCKGCLRTYRIDDKGNEHILQFCIENWWTGDRESLITGNRPIPNVPNRFVNNMKRHQEPFPRLDRMSEAVFNGQVQLRGAKQAVEDILQLDTV